VKEYGSHFEWENIIDTGNCKLLKSNSKNIYLRTGRECLLCIASKWGNDCRILMPALCCPAMVQPFRQMKFDIRYYIVNENFAVDYNSIKSLLSNNCLVLLINYYGIKSYDAELIRDMISDFDNVGVIQDCTHHIFTESMYDSHADFQVGSIRKWLAIPDGAFLYSRDIELENQYSNSENLFTDTWMQAMLLKQSYLQTGNQLLKDYYLGLYSKGMENLKGTIEEFEMSEISKKMMALINIDNVKETRRENYIELYSYVSNYNSNIVRYCVVQEAPLCLPIVVNRRDDVQRELARIGIYTQVLWPIPDDAKGISPFADYFSKHMLALPCDQRYSVNDMKIIGESTVNIIEMMK
jgi:hypothetical protein